MDEKIIILATNQLMNDENRELILPIRKKNMVRVWSDRAKWKKCIINRRFIEKTFVSKNLYK